MQKVFALLIALLGCLSLVEANLRLMNRVQEVHEYHTKRAIARGKLTKRGGILNNNYGIYALLQGLTAGLQFQEGVDSTCSTSIDSFILAGESATTNFQQIYIPARWSELALDLTNQQDAVAAVCTFCNFNKLVESITTSVGEGLSTAIARVGGAFMTNEIPDLYAKYVHADNDFVRGRCLGKLLKIVVNWQIK